MTKLNKFLISVFMALIVIGMAVIIASMLGWL
jgi:hypothetical protein